jgi:NAD(P)-dependent dehydrogenase (short-subunit alcohol dehydrogenase family)
MAKDDMIGATAVVTGASRGFGRAIGAALVEAGARVIGVARDHWAREALLAPLQPGSVVIAMSSGAALRGSPLSGGYAGAKAMVRFIASYAAEEAARDGLDIRFIALLPQLTAATDLGRDGVAAYARRAGVDVAAFVEQSGFTLTPQQVAKSVRDLASCPSYDRVAYVITPAGLNPVN